MDVESTISSYFGLQKGQAQLDFVDVPLASDTRLFVDPFALAVSENPWCRDAHTTLSSFFESVVCAIREGNDSAALEKLLHLREPNETHLGYSRGRPAGAGLGDIQAADLLAALKASSAVKSGFVKHLEESELMIPGIGRDKISDLTTNVIRAHLVDYSVAQCRLHGIPTQLAPLPAAYNASTEEWEAGYHELPIVDGQPLLLTPKLIVRIEPGYNHKKYYQHHVLNYLQAEHLRARSSLVHTLRDGSRRVYKKQLASRGEYKLSKKFLYEFSEQHPEVLAAYRDHLRDVHSKTVASTAEETRILAEASRVVLPRIPAGSEHAAAYHSFMVGVLELIFFPDLVNPKKEKEIHDGRKRIDIVMENAAPTGALHLLHAVKNIPCPYIVFECKNYTRDIHNPELDQIQGRLSTNRGRLGFALCRHLEDRALFVKRCQDTFRDGNGLIVVLQDADVLTLLEFRARGDRDRVSAFLSDRFAEVILS
jgi:hypothetical protein